MKTYKIYTHSAIASRIWFHTVLSFSAGAYCFYIFEMSSYQALLDGLGILMTTFVCAGIGSIPALLILHATVYRIERLFISTRQQFVLLLLLHLSIAIAYGLAAAFLSTSFSYRPVLWQSFFETTGTVTGVLFAATGVAVLINYRALTSYFNCGSNKTNYLNYSFSQINLINMEQQEQPVIETTKPATQSRHNKTLIKAGITAALILLMLIPVSFIQNLITERQERQEQIVKEVSSKWALAQTITTPYIVIPYYADSLSKASRYNLVLLPDNLNVKSAVLPVERARSIYNVLLYKSDVDISGNFHFALPQDMKSAVMLYNEAKFCIGISDFKGIEQQVTAHVNGANVTLIPGLPARLDSNGLSAPIALSATDFLGNTSFNLALHIKGSTRFHFIPMSTNSTFEVRSPWQNPSFDGSVIPTDKSLNDGKAGFDARWSFNNANLPFTNVLAGSDIKPYSDLAFGVSLVQPADQYAKTMRSVKYAILIIGLTFALFFIVELLQQKAVHPVQYVLVGLALVIFYSLLVSISEFILFSYAYSIAAAATIVLITLYTKSHFKSWKTTSVFFSVLTGLYAFIYVLISLEDTALLVGSIALFAVLAIVMYASRGINWYRPAAANENQSLLASGV